MGGRRHGKGKRAAGGAKGTTVSREPAAKEAAKPGKKGGGGGGGGGGRGQKKASGRLRVCHTGLEPQTRDTNPRLADRSATDTFEPCLGQGMGEAELRGQDEEPRSGFRATAASVLMPLRLALWPVTATARLLYAAARGAARMALGDGQPKRSTTANSDDDDDDDEAEEEAAPTTARAGDGSKKAGGKKAAKAAEHSHPRLLCTLKGFSEPITSATLSPDGALAAAVSTDRSLRVYPGLERAGEQW